MFGAIICRVDDGADVDRTSDGPAQKVDWLRVMPFLALHLGCIAVIWTGWSTVAVWAAAGLYLIKRMPQQPSSLSDGRAKCFLLVGI
ncbi:MAG: hypothetical protein AMJ65_03440 [Phycisphaerae bacterium SG8_4]|nr:MAG: hypothetical protein AMJ65_03440 [Phycisphaerae bacterium SG8_4]